MANQNLSSTIWLDGFTLLALETEGLQLNPSSNSLLKLVTFYTFHVLRWSLTIMVFKASCEIGKRIKACLIRNFGKGVFVFVHQFQRAFKSDRSDKFHNGLSGQGFDFSVYLTPAHIE
jgi:hypothetical protein